MREITVTNRFTIATADEASKALRPQPSEGAVVVMDYFSGQDSDTGEVTVATVEAPVATLAEARERARRVVGLPFVKSVTITNRESGREIKF